MLTEEEKENGYVNALLIGRECYCVKKSQPLHSKETSHTVHNLTTSIHFLRVSKSTKLFDSCRLPTASLQAGDGDELHGGLLEGVPAVVPRDPNNAVVIAKFTCILFSVPATYVNKGTDN